MIQGGNALIVARSRARAKKGKTHEEEDENDLTNVAADQLKYHNLLRGVQLGINLQAKNYNDAVTLDFKKTKQISVTNQSKFKTFHPNSALKMLWDVWLCALVVYSVMEVPFRIGFNSEPTLAFDIINWVVTGFFFLDLLATFNTAYFDMEKNIWIHDRTKIAKSYLQMWFWIDFLSTVPFNTLFGFFMPASQLSAIRIIRVMRLARLFKLFKLQALADIVESMNVSPAVINLGTLMIEIFFMAHWFACIWHGLTLDPSEPRNWKNTLGYDGMDLTSRYIASVYYIIVTMLTVGYGDIHPTNTDERMFGIVVMLSGGIVFGALISKVSRLIDKRNPQAKALKEKMDELKAYLHSNDTPILLRNEVKEAYSYYLRKRSAFSETAVTEQLPKPILYKLIYQVYSKDIKAIKMFRSLEPGGFVVTLVTRARPFQVPRSQVIFNQGDVMNEFIFITSGVIKMEVTDKVMGFSTSGYYFGDMEYSRNTVSMATYSAATSCTLLSLRHQDVNAAIATNIDIGVSFTNEIRSRLDLFQHVVKKRSEIPSAIRSRRSIDEGLIENMPVVANWREIAMKRGSHHRGSHHSPNIDEMEEETADTDEHGFLNTGGRLQIIWLDGKLENTGSLAMTALSKETGFSLGQQLYNCIIVGEDDKPMIREMQVNEMYALGLIHPDDPRKVAWDIFIGIFIIYSVLVTPVEIAFAQGAFNGSDELNIVIATFFLSDIIVSFRTGVYFEDNSKVVLIPAYIAVRYIKTWFLLDLASSIPFDSFVEGLSFTKILKVFRLFRLLKLSKLFAMTNYLDRLEDVSGLSPAVFDLIILLTQVFFIAHLVGCLWWGLTTVFDTGGPDASTRWYNRISDDYTLQSSPLAIKYVAALYFVFTTMTTVGYGDILPSTTSERTLSIFMILFGVSVFGYIIANVSGLLDNLNRMEGEKAERLAEVSEYLGEKQCSKELSDEVMRHYKNLFILNSAFDEEGIRNRLPHFLSDQLLLNQHEKRLKNISIFRYIHNQTVVLYLFGIMNPVFFDPDQIMLREGDASEEICFLVQGRARLFLFPQTTDYFESMKRGSVDRRIMISQKDSGRFSFKRGSIAGKHINAQNDTPSVSSSAPSGTYLKGRSSSELGFNAIDPNLEERKKAAAEKKKSPKANKPPVTDIDRDGDSDRDSPPALPLPDFNFVVPTEDNPFPDNGPAAAAFLVHESGTAGQLRNTRNRSRSATADPTATKAADLREGILGDIPEEIIKETSIASHIITAVSRLSSQDLKTDLSLKAKGPASIPSKKTVAAGASSRSGKGGGFPSPAGTSSSKGGPGGLGTKRNSYFDLKMTDIQQGNENAQEEHVPFSKYSDQKMEELGYNVAGTLVPGDFFGHTSLMSKTLTLSSIHAMDRCIVYTLSKEAITKQAKVEPTVAVQLQFALSQAMSNQVHSMGRRHMREMRAKFQLWMKDEYEALAAAKIDQLNQEALLQPEPSLVPRGSVKAPRRDISFKPSLDQDKSFGPVHNAPTGDLYRPVAQSEQTTEGQSLAVRMGLARISLPQEKSANSFGSFESTPHTDEVRAVSATTAAVVVGEEGGGGVQMSSMDAANITNGAVDRTPRSNAGSSPRNYAAARTPRRMNLMPKYPSYKDPSHPLPYSDRLGGLENAGPAKKAKRLVKLVKRLNAWYTDEAMNYESDDDAAIRASRLERRKQQSHHTASHRFPLLDHSHGKITLRRDNSFSSTSSISKTLKKEKEITVKKTVVSRAFVVRSMSCPNFLELTRSQRGETLVEDYIKIVELRTKEEEAKEEAKDSEMYVSTESAKSTSKKSAAAAGAKSRSASIQPFSLAVPGSATTIAATAAVANATSSNESPTARAAAAPRGGRFEQVEALKGALDFVLVRRQSFPSLDNETWRQSQIAQGLI